MRETWIQFTDGEAITLLILIHNGMIIYNYDTSDKYLLYMYNDSWMSDFQIFFKDNVSFIFINGDLIK